MRKTLLALSAATVIAAGTIASPTPSQANGLVVAAIVVGAVVATVIAVDAVHHHAYSDENGQWRHRRQHHRHHRHYYR